MKLNPTPKPANPVPLVRASQIMSPVTSPPSSLPRSPRLEGKNNSERHSDHVQRRTSQGIWVFSFTPGTTPDTLTVTQLASSGPMADANCFSNGHCWGEDASYYATIQPADLDATPGLQWSPDGKDPH
jgi:hypothetical protein